MTDTVSMDSSKNRLKNLEFIPIDLCMDGILIGKAHEIKHEAGHIFKLRGVFFPKSHTPPVANEELIVRIMIRKGTGPAKVKDEGKFLVANYENEDELVLIKMDEN